jgi:transglutaminase-like putative cysteine protease
MDRTLTIAGKNYPAEVLAIHRWVQNNIRYTRDSVGQETVQTPEHTAFVNQAGDCDDFSVLEAALLGALGHPTRFITIGYSPKAFSHLYRISGGQHPRPMDSARSDYGG